MMFGYWTSCQGHGRIFGDFPQMFFPSGIGVIFGSAAARDERYKLKGHLPNGK